MKNEIRLLMGLELRGLFGFNKFRHSRDPKKKRRGLLLGAVWLLLGAMICVYVGLLVYGLNLLGLGKIVPCYLAFLSCLLTFAFGLFKAGGMMFSRKGYESLCALPIRAFSIVASRFAVLYLTELAMTFLVMLPGLCVYGWLMRPEWPFYLTAFLSTLLLPALPLAAATAVGSLVIAVASRMKHKVLAEIALTLAATLAILACSTGLGWVAEDLTFTMLFHLADTIGMLLGRLYPPARWFAEGNLLLLLLVSAAVAALMLWVISRFFHPITRRLKVTSATHDYRWKKLQSSSLQAALYRKEMKRYFASSIYVVNTIISPIMTLGAGIALLFVDIHLIPSALTAFLPYVFALILSMMPLTSVSISMEGKQIWIAQSLPIPTKAWLNAKLMVNATLVLPFYLAAEVCLLIALKPSLPEASMLLLLPALLAAFAMIAALAVDIKLHRFDWEKEEAVVKQSASAGLGGFCGPIATLLCGAVMFLVPGFITQAATCLVLAAASILLYRSISRLKINTL